jgi:hypothetical protein
VSRSVFISHAVADKPLVEAFVRFLEEGIGLPEEEIFCVSIPGMGIPTGQNFVDYIRDEMTDPELVIMLLTPNYLASRFCQGEMGAAWVKGHRIYPVIVRPAKFADMDGVFLGKQAVQIDDDVRVNELKDALIEVVGFKPKSSVRWDLARKEFFGKLPGIITALPKPESVSTLVHNELTKNYNEALTEMGEQENEIRLLKERVAALESLKDVAQVAELTARFDNTGLIDQLRALLKNAKTALAALGPNLLRMHVLAKHYGKPFEGWREDRDVFDAAERRNLLTDDLELRYTSQAIKRVIDALEAIDVFVRTGPPELEDIAELEFDAPLEPDNEDFWRELLL